MMTIREFANYFAEFVDRLPDDDIPVEVCLEKFISAIGGERKRNLDLPIEAIDLPARAMNTLHWEKDIVTVRDLSTNSAK